MGTGDIKTDGSKTSKNFDSNGRRSHLLSLVLLGFLVFGLSFEIIRDALTKGGDFEGYVLVGNLVLQGENIYSNPLINTWPPFFSISSVIIALIDNFNSQLSRFIWLTLSLLAMIRVIQITTKMVLKRRLIFYPFKAENTLSSNSIHISHWIILVPILIVFRYILDNMSNIQINIFILFFSMISLYCFTKGKDVLAALSLAFGISLKVYPIFLLFYFLVKREFRIAGFTIFFCALFALFPFLVFGYEESINYYTFWYQHNVVPFASVAHKNQSFFSMMRSLLTYESPGLNQPLNKEIYINILNLSISGVKVVSYSLIALVGSAVVYIFRNKLNERNSLKSFLEYAFILTIIPILSPLAWKAYFIFLFPGYFVSCLFLFHYKNTLTKATNVFL
ncbi:MAG: glycosyltransferase family 87 protein, partial [Bacteroidota bacterium]